MTQSTNNVAASHSPASPLVILGGGYTLTRYVERRAGQGSPVVATTRDPGRRQRLEHCGAQVVSLQAALERVEDADVVLSIPPAAAPSEPPLDRTIAAALARHRPRRLVYLSSTGVYGGARGDVDEETPVDPTHRGASERLLAETLYRDLGGVVLRVAGIYGPGRGLHQRLLAGVHRLPLGEGHRRISRIHVDDLGGAIDRGLTVAPAGAVLCAADDEPAPQQLVVQWLCDTLRLPLPPEVPLASLRPTLQGDRAVRNGRLRALGWVPRYPTFREGFSAALEEESAAQGTPLLPTQSPPPRPR
jgi:nucleoside-diphosphate-sugar epimerase